MFKDSDVATFQKNLGSQKIEQFGVSKEQALLKKQYIEICQLKDGQTLTFDELSKMLNINKDEVEEWIIEAISNGILDCKIDQLEDVIVVNTTYLKKVDEEVWKQILGKVNKWKQRF
jgi:translation initiation factor 3 subunit M